MIFKKIYNVLSRICEPIACTCFALVVLVTFANVIFRYVFDNPLPWIEEFSYILYTYMVFFGLSLTHKRGSAVGVDIVVSLMPPKGQRIMNIISHILTIIIWIVLIVLGVKLATSKSTAFSVTPYLRMPYKYLYWFFPISGFFCEVELINRLVKLLRGEELNDPQPGDGVE